VVFFVGFGGKKQDVLPIFYLLRRFSEDCIVILLSLYFPPPQPEKKYHD